MPSTSWSGASSRSGASVRAAAARQMVEYWRLSEEYGDIVIEVAVTPPPDHRDIHEDCPGHICAEPGATLGACSRRCERWWGGPLDAEQLARSAVHRVCEAATLLAAVRGLDVSIETTDELIAASFAAIDHLRIDGRAPPGAPVDGRAPA